MEAPWRIEMLGGLRATLGDHVVTRFRSHQAGGLLAYLAFYGHRSHAREALIELLWPECDPEAGRNRFRVALSSLRRQLEPPGVPAGAVLVTDRANLNLNPVAAVTDVAQFEAALRAAERTPSAIEKQARLAEAIELYRGELLPGYFDEWVLPERGRLAEAFVQALRQLTALLEQAGDRARALQLAHRAAGADPLREETQYDLIRLLLTTGQPDAALRQARELERLLRQELGAAPAPATRALIREVEQVLGKGHHGGTETQRDLTETGTGGRIGSEGEARFLPVDPFSAGQAPDPSLNLSVSPCLRGEPASALPSGTVTLLLADIEASTALSERAGGDFTAALAECHELLRTLFSEHGGQIVQPIGDGFIVAFPQAGSALRGAIAGQQALEDLGSGARMALHTGALPPAGPDYGGAVLRGAQELLAAGHGGQILCSAETAILVRRELPEGVRLVDLGAYHLPGAAEPERLFRIEYPEIRGREFLPPRAAPVASGHVPLQFTRFFGREEELARLQDLLGAAADGGTGGRGDGETDTVQIVGELVIDLAGSPRPPVPPSPRLVTLVGPGGSGKTRLALETATRVRERFRRAVWFVSLADVTDPRLIPSKILDTLRPRSGPPHALLDPLRSPEQEPLDEGVAILRAHGGEAGAALLVLDNFEQLVEEGAAVVRSLLERLPALTLLVTSRHPLGLPGEQEFPVAPLPVPVDGGWWMVDRPAKTSSSELSTINHQPSTLAQCPSVQLFVDRAQAVRPDFQVTAGNAVAVAALCRRLEGIPLALELAAARARMLTPAQMLSRLDQRFELLTSRHREANARHRSLRATLDWSYQLLAPELQRFFARLSVFRGGFTLEAAEAVCGGVGVRCSVFGVGDTVRDARSPVSGDQTNRTDPSNRTPTSENQHPTPAARHRTPNTEHRTSTLLCLEELQESSLLVTQVTGDAARYRLLETLREYGEEQLGPGERATLRERHAAYYLTLAEEAEPGLLGPEQRARLAQLEEEHENLRAALDWCAAARDEGRGMRDEAKTDPSHPSFLVPHPLEMGLRLAGALWWFWTARGNLTEGRERLARLLALSEDASRQMSDATGGASSQTPDAREANMDGAPPRSDLASGVWRVAAGATQARAKARLCAAVLAQLQGDLAASRSLYEACLARAREVGDGWAIALSLTGLGFLAQFHGNNPAARSLLEQSLPSWQAIGQPWGTGLALNGLADVEVSEGHFAAALSLFEESLAIRRRLGDQWGIAVSVSGLGHLARERGDWAEARRLYEESLTLRRELGDRWGIAECLEDVAALALAAGPDADTAARLFGAAAALRDAIGAPVRPVQRAGYERQRAVTRAALGEAGFAAAWESGCRLTWEQAVAVALEWLGV